MLLDVVKILYFDILESTLLFYTLECYLSTTNPSLHKTCISNVSDIFNKTSRLIDEKTVIVKSAPNIGVFIRDANIW